MDSRFIFLHHAVSELRGHGEEARARDGAGSKRGIRGGLNQPVRRARDGERTISSEERGGAVEKSRYRVLHARTVNRHRWMRRGP